MRDQEARKKVIERRPDILDDLAKNHGRDVSRRMVWNGRAAAVSMPILHVRTTLAGQNETKRIEDAANLPWLENGRPRHQLRRHRDALRADELRLQIRLTVFQQHLNALTEISMELVERLPLRMRARNPRHETDVKSRVRTTLDDSGKRLHGTERMMPVRLRQCVACSVPFAKNALFGYGCRPRRRSIGGVSFRDLLTPQRRVAAGPRVCGGGFFE